MVGFPINPLSDQCWHRKANGYVNAGRKWCLMMVSSGEDWLIAAFNWGIASKSHRKYTG